MGLGKTADAAVQEAAVVANIKPLIIDGGLHSFALGVIDSANNISFYSKENLILKGDFNSNIILTMKFVDKEFLNNTEDDIY